MINGIIFLLLLMPLSNCGKSIFENEVENPEKPNIVFVLTDDQRYDAIGCLGKFPWLQTPNIDRLVNEGVLFENAFVTTSLCSPSRASFLTGTYAFRHGVIVNAVNDPKAEYPIFPELLQNAGYETAYIGKWHMNSDANPRKGIDHWVSFRGQGKYYGTTFNINGEDVAATKYISDELNDFALEFIQKEREKPFMLYLSHKAIHGPFIPAERHTSQYENEAFQSLHNSNDQLDKKTAFYAPEVAVEQPKFTAEKYIDMLRSISAVDDGIGKLLEELEKQGELENTIFLFAGDNGYFFGEHGGFADKRKAYEPSMRIPLVMRYPKKAQAGSVVSEFVLNIDLAPSLLDIANADIPAHMDGQSWFGLLDGSSIGRESFMYEYYNESIFRAGKNGRNHTPTVLALRTKEYKYIEYPDFGDSYCELYDLENDSEELYNLIGDSDHIETLKEMKQDLQHQKKMIGYKMPEIKN